MRYKLGFLIWITIIMGVCSFVLEKPKKPPVPTDVHPHIQQLHIQSDIRYRFSTTVVKSKMVNPDDVAREVIFDVTLPNEAFMTNFTLEIDGKIHVGQVKEKEVAKKQFEDAKARGQSAGHISAKTREANKFNIEVNLAAKESVNFVLTYQELLRRKLGLYEHAIHINPGQLVPDLKVEVAIQESRAIATLNVPELRKNSLTDKQSLENGTDGVIVKHDPTSTSAYVVYQPNLEQQKQVSEKGVAGQFVVQYGVNREENAGDLLLVNGYFVHYFAVDSAFTMPKNVLFVLDTSGSMGGRKIIQLRDAMLNILDDVHAKDKFNIMTFSSGITYWKGTTLLAATTKNINEAKNYIRRIRARGGTNINRAVTEGINMLQGTTGKRRAPILLFLTDGQATVGERRNDRILSNVQNKNEGTIPIFSLAFGDGADYTFVKKLAAQNNGIGRKIYEDSDANLQIQGLYDEISTVLLKNVTFNYLNGTVDEKSITKVHFNTFFKGSELMFAGKLANNHVTDLGLSVEGESGKGKISFKNPSKIVPNFSLNFTGNRDIGDITEKLWAYLTIKQLLKEREAATTTERKDRLKKKVIDMSLKYNFVTPLTSMVVTLPDSHKQLEEIQETPVRKSFRGSSRSSRRRFKSSRSRLGGPSARVARRRFRPKSRLAGSSVRFASLPRLRSRPAFDLSGLISSRRLSFGAPGWGSSRGGTQSLPAGTIVPVPTTVPPIFMPTTTLPLTTTTSPPTTTTAAVQSSGSRGRSVMIKVPAFPNGLCIDFQLKPRQRYTLLDHPDIIIEATASSNADHISKITAKTNGHTLIFLPKQYSIDGIVYTYTDNTFKLNKYNTNLGFNIGIVLLTNPDSLMFYMEFPTYSSKLGGLLARYEDVTASSFSSTMIGSSYTSNFYLKKGRSQTYYSYQSKGIQLPVNPLRSRLCWIVKDRDIIFT